MKRMDKQWYAADLEVSDGWAFHWPIAHILDLGSMTLQTSSSDSIVVPINKSSQKEKSITTSRWSEAGFRTGFFVPSHTSTCAVRADRAAARNRPTSR